jgi:hypothetical protein
VQAELKAIVEKFRQKNGVLRGERLPSNANNLSFDPMLWGYSIWNNFPQTSYMESYVDHQKVLQAESESLAEIKEDNQVENDEEISYISGTEEKPALENTDVIEITSTV